MPAVCCVVTCKNRGYGNNLRFFRLPAELKLKHKHELNTLSKERRQAWLSAIKRKDFTGSKLKHALVCSNHFLNGQPADLRDKNNPDWIPSLNLGYEISLAAEEQIIMITENICDQTSTASSSSTVNYGEDDNNSVVTEESQIDKMCQTDITGEEFSDVDVVTFDSLRADVGHTCSSEFTYKSLANKHSEMQYYTGFSTFKKLEMFVRRCRRFINVKSLDTVLDPQNQIFLTLIKLRLDLAFEDLEYRFNISRCTALMYFKAVIDAAYLRLSDCVIWPNREFLKRTTPRPFKECFGLKTPFIIDYFEVFIEKPSNMQKAEECWSNDKHGYTMKYLIGIIPQGKICFISGAWGGSTSDKHIIQNCKILDFISPGDLIVMDRGLVIKEYEGLLRTNFKTPAFTKIDQKSHRSEIEETGSIADVRIHVEKLLTLIKQKFRILSNKMPINCLSGDDDPILDKIIFVCCALINLDPPIIPLLY